MHSHALSPHGNETFPPAQLQTQLRDAFPSGYAARSFPSLDNFASVDEMVMKLQPSEPVFCIEPAKLRECAAGFLEFPGRPLFAVKCNPHPFVLKTLYEAGITDFDVASLHEVELIHGLFGSAAGQYFNNPAKTRKAVRAAHGEHAIRFYTADCREEIEKIVAETGGGDDLIVAVRLATYATDARYDLSSKFGASPDLAVDLLRCINCLGIKVGISFHVGSQCLSPGAFGDAVALADIVARESGVELSVLNVGGGFPAPYPGDGVLGRGYYFRAVEHAIRTNRLPSDCIVLCEPGRGLVATSGTTVAQVVMRRGENLFLNDGIFGTLQELGHPKERRPLRLIRNGARVSAGASDFKVWGPTCDSNDVLGAPFNLPADVREGDWIEIGMMGAYSLSMRTHFNGFFADKIVTLGD